LPMLRENTVSNDGWANCCWSGRRSVHELWKCFFAARWRKSV
jgi:hypothetical protein